MRTRRLGLLIPLFLVLTCAQALGADKAAPTDTHAQKYADAIQTFKEAGESGKYFNDSYGYAIFPSIGKGAIGIGGAHGGGRVYTQGTYVGDTKMTQVTVGFQLGGQVYSEAIFFQNKEAFDKFASGKFEFGAQAAAVAITAGASAQAGTGGSGASASGDENHARTAGGYQNGMAIFTVAKGGLMYEASIGGQKFSYKPVVHPQ
jgi:lipid-binding SYLF domain-containing protein